MSITVLSIDMTWKKLLSAEPTVHLSENGLAKLEEARKSGVEQMPDWLREDMINAATDPK